MGDDSLLPIAGKREDSVRLSYLFMDAYITNLISRIEWMLTDTSLMKYFQIDYLLRDR